MLVLSRRVGERVLLDGGAVVVTVLAVRGSQIRLGFDAPPDVDVQREELAVAPPRTASGRPRVRKG